VYDFGDYFPHVRGLVMPPSAYLIAWADFLNSILPIVNDVLSFKAKISETGLEFEDDDI
jgi:hypothetical protein